MLLNISKQIPILLHVLCWQFWVYIWDNMDTFIDKINTFLSNQYTILSFHDTQNRLVIILKISDNIRKKHLFCLYSLFIWRAHQHPTVYHDWDFSIPILYHTSDKVYQLLAHGWWFSPGTPASSTTKIGCHDIPEILLKVELKHQKLKKLNQSGKFH